MTLQVFDRFTVNDKDSVQSGKPLPAIAKNADFYYDKTPRPDPWPHWVGGPYNDTTFTLFLDGESDSSIAVRSRNCAAAGCKVVAVAQANNRAGSLYWSVDTTWTGATPPMAVPKDVRARLYIKLLHGPGWKVGLLFHSIGRLTHSQLDRLQEPWQ